MNRGFTLIELLIVVVIIGIIVSIAIPNFIRVSEKAKEASLMSNMHTIQVQVELYWINNEHYPANASIITYPPNFKNPWNPQDVPLQDESAPDIRGVVEYKVNETFDYYWITGINGRLKPLDLVLTPGKHMF
uniref:Prepilin-type N-terminal cleavage/methylation domain-containing protein n=1 Tax=candidate division WOR-3 bacterium TaxID=2052148 RepID=A0A7C4YCW9_UNCW3